jgi:magnesium chelatase family protein
VLIGELALDGRLRPVRGVLPAILADRRMGIERLVVPAVVLGEATLVEGVRVYGATHLKEVIGWLGGPTAGLTYPGPLLTSPPVAVPDLANVLHRVPTIRTTLAGLGCSESMRLNYQRPRVGE